MGRLFKTYYVGLLSHHAKEDIQQAERVTTITTLSVEPRSPHLISRSRRESQSRASNSDPSDSEQDIRSQSQSRDSASDHDLDLSDTEVRVNVAPHEEETHEDMDVETGEMHLPGDDEASRPLIAAIVAAAAIVHQDDIDVQADDETGHDEDEDIEIDDQANVDVPQPTAVEENDTLDQNDKPSITNDSSNKMTSDDLYARLLKKRLQGNDQIMVCSCCGTHVTHKHDQIADCFQGQTGSACLYGAAMNVTLGRKSRRELLSGAHDVADVFCGHCGELLGWTYFLALDEKHRYKVGTYCFEDALLASERQFLETAALFREGRCEGVMEIGCEPSHVDQDDEEQERPLYAYYRGGEVAINSLNAIRRAEGYQRLL